MTIRFGFLAFLFVTLLALIGLLYAGLHLIGRFGRFKITLHRKTIIKVAITCFFMIGLFDVINTNCVPGSFFYPVWHWIENGFAIIAAVFVILGIAYLFLPNMPGKDLIESYYSSPIFKAFRISRKNKSEQ